MEEEEEVVVELLLLLPLLLTSLLLPFESGLKDDCVFLITLEPDVYDEEGG